MYARKFLLGGLVGAAAVGVIAACQSGCNSSDQQTAGHHPAVVQHHDAKPAKPAQHYDAEPVKPARQYTTAQENAIGSAEAYLSVSGFSRAGLIQQLSSSYGDGYSKADATFAVNHLDVDWNQQAVRSARDYLSTSHFSRAGLIEQLSSPYGDGYTKAQAIYAANHVGL
jgi:host cell surface-exposed lipoprotein